MTMDQGPEQPMMFHYLLQMHKGGKVMLHMEMNVPVESFPFVQMNSLLSLEAMLLDYGKRQGYTRLMDPGQQAVEQ